MSGEQSEIRGETIAYQAGGHTMQGYLASPKAGEKSPGVLVIHEWWGLTDYIKGRARQLAQLGFNALAVDMYGNGETALTPDEAGAKMNAVLGDMDVATQRIEAAIACLSGHAQTDTARLGAIGYCFGGAMVLHAARKGLDLAGVVSFHGSLGSTHTPVPGTVKARVLVCHGADDSLVPDDQIDAFKSEMDTARADYRFIAYPGALHGFTNPDATANGEKYGLPLAYDAATDQSSWNEMQRFFAKVFA